MIASTSGGRNSCGLPLSSLALKTGSITRLITWAPQESTAREVPL